MPKKIPLVSVRVSRDGKSITPPLGVPFDFTKEELDDLAKLSAQTNQSYVRDPVNETADASDAPAKPAKGEKKGAAFEL